MSKFKVGDIVRGVKKYPYNELYKARILAINGDDTVKILILNDKDKSLVGTALNVLTNKLDLVEAYQDWKVVIVPRGNKTIAKLYKNNAVVKTVECKKHPDDEYSMDEAIKVVTERLREPEKPKYYNGKVVCIDNIRNPTAYTVGKIYQFKDGQLRTQDGIKFPLDPVTSFTEFQQQSYSKWLEVVE